MTFQKVSSLCNTVYYVLIYLQHGKTPAHYSKDVRTVQKTIVS